MFSVQLLFKVGSDTYKLKTEKTKSEVFGRAGEKYYQKKCCHLGVSRSDNTFRVKNFGLSLISNILCLIDSETINALTGTLWTNYDFPMIQDGR